MKKQGFTLAEVLVAMGLVGVIAAMTLPTFVSNCRQQANDAKFSSTSVDIENAIGNMIVTELVDDFTGTAFYSTRTKEKLEKYVKLINTGSKNDLYGADTKFKTGKSCTTNLSVSPTLVFELKNSAYFLNINTTTAYIDVNGKDNPNCLNKDLYKVTITDEGLLEREE